MRELEDLEKLKSMDLVQKSRVKWEVEGDKNSKFFHGLINSRRKSQMVQGIMLDGVWNSDPKDIKSAFLDFHEDKFSCHDSPISFPLMLPAHRLSITDQNFLESMVSMDEIKAAVWDCGSQKAPRLDGSNPAFITLIPKVSNPLFIKEYRHVSIIGIHYKIVAKILANRLSKGLHMALNDGLATNMFHDVKVGSPVRVSSNKVEIMASYTGSNMSRITNWKPLIDRFKARLSSWKANLLSIGGLLTLIKVVLGSLGNYYLSVLGSLYCPRVASDASLLFGLGFGVR
ncbi:hypothetical protein Tco_0771915 [Tanacetum coccineum]|uniref:Reverse transcriptase n=1 Tax=Tanacetum coccineum TaxID=301880 RepID=A0ABQ4ZGG4_9ASTR